ncbi:hypothetical protein [Nonomuraea sp. NPDC050783]|uniref:hypothetical protein n=1 Tax=Nonomuraea sp. NPDC050783 TaxID=3154634 RepID=UPI003465697E
MLPRPLAALAALALVAATTAAVRLLPAGAAPPAPPAGPPAAPSSVPRAGVIVRHTPALSVAVTGAPVPVFARFVDTAREPGFDLPAEALRTGVRHYLLGHLVAGGADGCSPRWASPDGTHLGPGENPVANRIGRLRALGGDAAPSFGGAGGADPAAVCVRPGGLAAAYRRVVGAFDAGTLDFEPHDAPAAYPASGDPASGEPAPGDPGPGADAGVVLRRARALRALQRERPLRVSFTLPLRASGLDPADAAALRTTRQAGADVATVNLLALLEPRAAPAGRLGRLATAVHLARAQIARAQALDDPEEAWRRVALTLFLEHGSDLDVRDARTLKAYAARHGLAWLSLRGAAPDEEISDVLRGTAP